MKYSWKDSSQYFGTFFIIYSFLNIIALLLYFMFCSNISGLAHAEQRDYYDGIDGITYSCTALPVLAFGFLINVAWGIKTMIDLIRRKGFHALVAGVIAAILWAVNVGLCNFIAWASLEGGTNHYSEPGQIGIYQTNK